MHELGLCSSIVEAVERRAGERQVAGVRVRVGRLHRVHPDAFAQSFALAASGTVAAGARAELVLVPVRARCASCGGSWDDDREPALCPRCGSLEVGYEGGDDLVLESIEYRSSGGR